VLVSAAGLSIEYLRNERALAMLGTLENRLAAYSGWLASRSDALARRPGARRMIFGIVAHRPDRLPGPLVAEQVRGSGKPGFLPALDALTDYPIRDRLGEIACPTLIVWGAEDKLVPARDADEFARLIPNSRKVVWPQTGHVAMLERPERRTRPTRRSRAPARRGGAVPAAPLLGQPPPRGVVARGPRCAAARATAAARGIAAAALSAR
jgi:pimeloyl-ACP methyl ester carboxylesterase